MKGKKTDLGEARCAIARSLQVFGDWWSILIIRDAFAGKRRFGEFQKSLGLAKNILAQRLRKLVDDDIFSMEPGGEGSAYSHYVLTEKGEKLCVVMAAIWQWGEEYCFPEDDLMLEMRDRAFNQPLARLALQSEDGSPVGPRDFIIAKREGLSERPHLVAPT